MLTQSELKEILHYNQNTGVFTWISRPSKCIHIGDIAGTDIRKRGHKYRLICINGKQFLAQRLAFLYMTGSFPLNRAGYINGDGLDNRWANLADRDAAENGRNSRLRTDSTSGFCGVIWSKGSLKWRVYISPNGLRKHVGYFVDKQAAIKARQAANIKYGFHKNHGQVRPL